MPPADYRYRGYWIRHNAINGLWWVEKGRAFVCYATDRTHGIRIIDEVLHGAGHGSQNEAAPVSDGVQQ